MIADAKSEAFSLLDALTKAGALPVQCADLHVVVAGTHTFDKSLMDTIVKGNVNPICKVERSSLIMAGIIRTQPPVTLNPRLSFALQYRKPRLESLDSIQFLPNLRNYSWDRGIARDIVGGFSTSTC